MSSPACGDVRDGEELRGVARRGRERRDAALERGDPLLEDVRRRVHDPRVDVPELLQREEAARRARRVSNVYDVVW